MRRRDVHDRQDAPANSKSIGIEEPVPDIDLALRVRLVYALLVVVEIGEVVLADLPRDRVLGLDEYVLEQAVLRRGDVGKPTAHGEGAVGWKASAELS